jgi:hypothetical protein
MTILLWLAGIYFGGALLSILPFIALGFLFDPSPRGIWSDLKWLTPRIYKWPLVFICVLLVLMLGLAEKIGLNMEEDRSNLPEVKYGCWAAYDRRPKTRVGLAWSKLFSLFRRTRNERIQEEPPRMGEGDQD